RNLHLIASPPSLILPLSIVGNAIPLRVQNTAIELNMNHIEFTIIRIESIDTYSNKSITRGSPLLPDLLISYLLLFSLNWRYDSFNSKPFFFIIMVAHNSALNLIFDSFGTCFKLKSI